jgi:hypothetical protein
MPEPGQDAPSREALRAALKRTGSALKHSGLPFALAGSYALWAHGGPESEHDVDFMITEADVEAAAGALADAGLSVRRPPEDWLFKIDTDGATVDILHRAAGTPVTAELLAHSSVFEVLSVQMPVLHATDVVSGKLRAMSEHYCDFGPLLAAVRAVREQIDWPRLRREVAGHDYAAAFLFLLDRLAISPAITAIAGSRDPLRPCAPAAGHTEADPTQ